MIEYLNISKYIQPYLPRFLITDYYKQYFEICLIDIIYFYFNHPYLYDAKSMIYKNVKDIVSQHMMKYDFTCNMYDDIYDVQELNETKLHWATSPIILTNYVSFDLSNASRQLTNDFKC